MKRKIFNLKIPTKKYTAVFCIFIFMYALFAYILYKSGIGCVFRYFFDFSCPGCGMTRALICVARLDFKGALMYNPLIFIMPFVLFYLFFNGKVFSSEKANSAAGILIGLLFLISFILRNL